LVAAGQEHRDRGVGDPARDRRARDAIQHATIRTAGSARKCST
jgi:hypothetical protein